MPWNRGRRLSSAAATSLTIPVPQAGAGAR
jgi:hypothetical protein